MRVLTLNLENYCISSQDMSYACFHPKLYEKCSVSVQVVQV